jgi:site-specific DNA-cytosine methylase
MKVFIDLFSGLGGASVAFDRSPDWVVLKFDNNPELIEHNRGLTLLDLSDLDTSMHTIRLMLHEINERYCGIHKLVIWASPPCNEFSFANANRPENPSTVLIENALRLYNNWTRIIGSLRTFTGQKERSRRFLTVRYLKKLDQLFCGDTFL